jgi:hypothetical protein
MCLHEVRGGRGLQHDEVRLDGRGECFRRDATQPGEWTTTPLQDKLGGRAVAAELLPGALREQLLWRYTLVWRRPRA